MEKTVYELMHGEKVVADIGTNGVCTVLDRAFLPFSIYLEDTAENDDLDIRMDNLTNFYYWCATRVLTLDRVYAKEILNSIGALQAQTDRDRAKIALSYHCLSLTDINLHKIRKEYKRKNVCRNEDYYEPIYNKTCS